MSVAVSSNTDLEAMWGVLGADDTSIARSLIYVGTANRAAFMASYNEDAEHVAIEAPSFSGVPSWAQTAEAWLRNLLYNCITNGGCDFAPADHAARLLDVARLVDAKSAA